jgi:hypothetical protein
MESHVRALKAHAAFCGWMKLPSSGDFALRKLEASLRVGTSARDFRVGTDFLFEILLQKFALRS